MRFLLLFFAFFLLACGTKKDVHSSNPIIDFFEQEAVIEKKVISRGSYQFLLVVSSGEKAGKYLPDEPLAEEYQEDGLQVIFDAELMEKKGMVYKPGATDVPEDDYELPMVKILAIRKGRS